MAFDSNRTISLLHGLLTWAVVSVVTLFFIGYGVGRVLGTTFGLAGSGIQGLGSVGAGSP